MSHSQSILKHARISGHYRILCCLSYFAFVFLPISHSQSNQDSIPEITSIFQLMERNDLSLAEIQQLAEKYFVKNGSGRGSGYKQYQRWLYERRFHVDEQGYLIDPMMESASYQSFLKRQNAGPRSTQPWEEMGPDTWSNTSGWNPGIGRITSVAIHPSNESVIYVSSPGGGIWKSTNGGSTWSPLMDYTNAAWMFVYNIRIDPSNQNTIYAALMNGGGVIKSTNAGNSWSATGIGPFNTGKVVVHPTNSNIVLATATNGIWRSTNGGTTWTQVHASGAEDIEFKPDNPDILYSSGFSNTVKRSTNNGVTWTEIGAAGGITHSGRTLLGVTPDNPNIVYAVQANGNIFGRLYKSNNAGLNYVTTVVGNPASGTNFFGYDPLGMDALGQAEYDMAICVNPANDDEVHIAGIACWKSTNGGVNFTAETVWSYPNDTGYNHADVHALEWINNTIYSGSDGGIYKSTNNGGDWTDLSIGLGIRQVYRLALAKTNAEVITIGSQDNGSSFRQSSGTWVEWLGADGMDNIISPTNAAVAYGMWQNGGLNKTINSGQTRTYIEPPSEGAWITPIDMHPTNHDHIYVGWTGVWKSTNGGTSWTNISTGYITKKVNTLVVAESNVNHIYASVSDTLYRTTNGGTTWSFVTMAGDVTSVFVSSTDPAKIWVTLNTTNNQVLFSSNGGTNFTSISSGLPALNARTVVVDENDADGLYVGLNIGVYFRNNDEPSWIPFGTELPLIAINELEIHESSGKIRVATYGRGVWENDLNTNTGDDCPEYAYVPNSNSNTVSVVELPSNTLVTTINVGTNPVGVCHTSTADKVFITNLASDNVSIITTSNNQVIATIALPANAGPSSIAITPENTHLFVTNSENGTVTVIDASTYAIIQTITVGGEPFMVQVSPDGTKAYVTDYDLKKIHIINTSNYTLGTPINLSSYPLFLRFTPDGTLLFVLTLAEELYMINATNNTLIDSLSFPFGYYSTAMCMSPSGEKLYCGFYDDTPGPGLGVVDVSSFTIETYATGFCCGVGGLSTSGDGSLLYVSNPSYNKVSVINTTTNAFISSFNVGSFPTGRGDFVLNCEDMGGDPSVCGTEHYDSGGPTGEYSDDENIIEILCPDNPEESIELNFTVFATESGYDYLKIFNGNSINSPPLHAGNGFSGTTLPGTFTSTHTTGCLTVQFTSDGSIVDTGWVAEVSCVNGSCESDFYDTGGLPATYSPDEDVITTLCPGANDEAIHVEFLAFAVEVNYDALYVYDGPTITSPIISSGNGPTISGFPEGGYYGTGLPGPFTSSDPEGCLTFRFLSDESVQYAGWNASVTCLSRPENDLCGNAILIDCNETIVGSNENATSDIEDFCGTFPGTKGVWYKIIGNGESITLTTCDASTDFDTQIHVYTGTCSVVECIAQNDDDPLCVESSLNSTLTFESQNGEEYFILVSGYQQNEGAFSLESICSTDPMDNNCLHFDGVNDNVYGASNALFEFVDGTIEMWVRPELKTTSQTFICYRNDAGSATRFLFNFLGNLSGLGFWNGSAYATFPYTFTANQWYHLAFVDDGINTKIYINGEYEGAFTIQFSSASGPQLHLVLGYDIPLSEYFKGAIDEVRIWSSPLSASTILENRDCGVSANEDCLVAYYRFNQGTPAGANGGVTTLLDETNNNLDATLINFALSGTTSNWISATNGVSGNCAIESCPSYEIISLSILQDCLLFGEDTLEYYITWSEEFGLLGNTSNGTITLDPADGNWSSSNTNVVTIIEGHLEAIGPGTATITVTMTGVTSGTALVRVIAPVLEPVYNTIPELLASPHNPCAAKDMPVIIIRYLPTTDGVNLDVAHAPDYFNLGEITLSQMQQNLAAFDNRIRFALEEGTRYRDYGQDITSSYLGYRVVEMITVYEPTPRGPLRTYDVNGLPIFEIDYHSVFERFNLEQYVNTLGVKEVWFWQYGMESGYPSYDPEIHFPCNFRFAWESNMASPVTHDVSNSNQDTTDLPIYDRTYIVYGQNIRRSQAEAIHNHGHQIERMIPYMNYLQDGNTLLFWRDFVGQDDSENFITGRCGWTHMPPNTITHYDYQNSNLVLSDIMDWMPSGGTQQNVNANVWGTMNYEWPGSSTFSQKTESQWYIFWMQSFPGNHNLIEYGSDYMTNWWDIIADWDLAIANGLGLYSDTPASNTMQNEVVTTGTAGYGSLRSTISCAPSGSTITFSPYLASDTLDILSPIIIDKAIYVDGTSYPGLFLDGSSSTFVFDILNSGTLDLESMYIKCGTNTLQSGLRNWGDTDLKNMIFKTNINSPIINNRNFLSLTGTNTLLRN